MHCTESTGCFDVDVECFGEYLHLIATMLHSLKMHRRVQEQLWASSQYSSMPDVQMWR